MGIDTDKHGDFELEQKNILRQNMTGPSRIELPKVPHRPKKMRLEHLSLTGTTSAIIRASKNVHVECLPEYFEQACDRHSRATAAISGLSHLTYQDLDRQANRLAHFLISRGIKEGNPVGILLDRSLDTYVALLGVLKAGAAFVPLDPSFSPELMAFIASDAGLHGLVTTSTFRAKTSTLSCPLLELDQVDETLALQPETRPQIYADPASLCYRIYTLDAPDQSKGISVTHSTIVNFLRVNTPIYRVTRIDRVYQGISISSDDSILEIWPTWIAGATLIAAPPQSQYFDHELTDFLINQQITVLNCTPSLLATIGKDVPSLRCILISGGTYSSKLVSRWSSPRCRILNTYNPTETQSGIYSQVSLPSPQIPHATPPPQLSTSTTPFTTSFIPTDDPQTPRRRIVDRINLKNIYTQIMTDPLYKNSLFNMASTLILGGLGFVFWIIIARLYKTENVGIATTLISIMTLLSSFTILGFNVSLNRFLPRSTQKDDLINSSFVIVTLVTILVSAIFLLGLHTFSPQLLFLQSNIFYIISFTIFVIFCSWNSLVESISMAFRSASNILIKNTTISLLKLLFPFVFIALGAYGIFTSTALAVTLGVLFSFIILIVRFKIRLSVAINVPLIKETGAYSFANFITDFMFNMPSLVLPVIILNILSAKYAAYYYVASMVQSILLIIPLATSQALLTEGSYNEEELRKHVKKALVTILYILIPTTAVTVLAGNLLLQFFGKSYADEAFQFLRLYSISTIFTSLLLISNAIMNVKHQIKSLVFLNVVAAIVTLWFSYAFISHKLVGIGWGWILGQAIAGALALCFIIRNLYVKK